MNKRIKKITLLAFLTALSLAFMFFAAVMPTGQLGFLAAASLCGIVAVFEYGFSGGALVYAASAILGFLLIPEKGQALIYTLFFGYYPIIKSAAEKQRSRIIEWSIKLLILNVSLCVMLFVFILTVFDISRLSHSYILLFVIFNLIFIVFDIGVSKLISFYALRIRNRVRRR